MAEHAAAQQQSFAATGVAPPPAAGVGAAPAGGAPAAVAAPGAAAVGGAGTAAADGSISKSNSLYVGDLHKDATEADLFTVFSRLGTVASIRVCRDELTRQSLGYAYVNYYEQETAQKAITQLQFATIKDQPVRVMWSQRNPNVRKLGEGNVFIKNLAPNVDHRQLLEGFQAYGTVMSSKVVRDTDTLESRGYGYVHFETKQMAEAAVNAMNGAMFHGQEIQVEHFKRRAERLAQLQWTNLYVKNIPDDWTESRIRDTFNQHGTVTSIFYPGVGADESHKGVAFVNMSQHAEALACVEALNNVCEVGTDTEGKPVFLVVERHQSKAERKRQSAKKASATTRPSNNGTNLYVKNIDESVTDEQFRKLFEQFGTVTSAVIMRQDGISRGFGFCNFDSASEANKAMTEVGGRMFPDGVNGKPLYVAIALSKKERAHQVQLQIASRPNFHQNSQMYAGARPSQVFNGMQPQNMMPRGRVPPYNQMNMMGHQPRHQFNQRPAGHMNARPQMPAAASGAPMYPRPAMQMMPQQPGMVMPPQIAPQMQQPQLSLPQLEAMGPSERKNALGERLFPKIQVKAPEGRAGKITGMLLDLEYQELLTLLQDDQALQMKIDEALQVLAEHSGSRQ